jgi:type IV/VI secretion system ImpK/VasF family protein
MREEIAALVHPVIAHGLRLKERLDNGAQTSLAAEQAALTGKLQDPQGQRWPDFAGDAASIEVTRLGGERVGGERFLGARYALVCWLDELFILQVANREWASAWNEKKLEEALYRTNDRAWKFWEQARRSEARAGADALEVFYLCALLGFRGDLVNRLDRLQIWRHTVDERLGLGEGAEWASPPALKPVTNVPALRGRERFQQLLLAACVALGLLIPVTTFFLVSRFGK